MKVKQRKLKKSLCFKKTNEYTFSVSLRIIDSTAAESTDDLYVASSVRIATAVSMLTDEKSP